MCLAGKLVEIHLNVRLIIHQDAALVLRQHIFIQHSGPLPGQGVLLQHAVGMFAGFVTFVALSL